RAPPCLRAASDGEARALGGARERRVVEHGCTGPSDGDSARGAGSPGSERRVAGAQHGRLEPRAPRLGLSGPARARRSVRGAAGARRRRRRQDPLPARGACGARPPPRESSRGGSGRQMLSRRRAALDLHAVSGPGLSERIRPRDRLSFRDRLQAGLLRRTGRGPAGALRGWVGSGRRGKAVRLVGELTGLNGSTWLVGAGNSGREMARVVERYPPLGPRHLEYAATIEDPTVFSRPWTIRMPLYRIIDEDFRMLEFKCEPFAEEKIYGHLRKPGTEPVRGSIR